MLELDVDDSTFIDVGVTDADISSRSAIRLTSLSRIKRARIRRNTVEGTVVGDGDFTSGSPIVSNVTNIEDWFAGASINCIGSLSGTTVVSTDVGAGRLTMSTNAVSTIRGNRIYAHSRQGVFGNADIESGIIEFNDFDRETITVSGTAIQLIGVIGQTMPFMAWAATRRTDSWAFLIGDFCQVMDSNATLVAHAAREIQLTERERRRVTSPFRS